MEIESKHKMKLKNGNLFFVIKNKIMFRSNKKIETIFEGINEMHTLKFFYLMKEELEING